MNNKAPVFFFDEPRFRLSLPGRLFVRAGSVVFYLAFTLATVLALASDINWVRWLGVFGGLILADRILHRHDGDYPIPELLKQPRLNLAQALSPALARVLEHAYERSVISGTDPGLEFLRALLGRKDVREGLWRLDVDPREFDGKASELLGREEGKSALNKDDKVRALAVILGSALEIALKNGNRFVMARDAFAALAADGGEAGRLFQIFDITPGDVSRALIFGSVAEHASIFGGLPDTLGGFVLPAHRVRERVVNRAWTSRATPVLDRYGTDFNLLAARRQSGFLVGHDTEYQRLLAVLSRSVNPNALLVGEEGIGKEALISHLAFAIEKDKVPPPLFDRRIVSLDLSLLAAGAPPEEVQKRMAMIVQEIMLAGNVILLIQDGHNLVKGEGLSVADALLPILRNNAFPVIATTYPREYKAVIEPASGLQGIFETIRISEISIADAERILVYESILLERRYKVFVSFGAVKAAVALAKKYFRNSYLPGSALDLLSGAIAHASEIHEKKVDRASIIRAAESKVNVPLRETDAEERERLLNLEKILHDRVIGQDEAVGAVSDALREYRSGLARKGGPIASFLFVGPTGVGKTELAKALAAAEFGSEGAIIRLDMSEYKDAATVARLIGSPDGKSSGQLTEAIKKAPYALVLLDEFEKAYPEIWDLFLQVLDDGRLTDNIGTTVSFENTIIIATSNAHTDLVHEALTKGGGVAAISEYLKSRLTDVFRPELLNRFSKIVVFKELGIEEVRRIATIELKKLAKSVEPKGLTLAFDPEVGTKLAQLGYDPAFGARNLARAVEAHLRAPLAQFLLRENPARGTIIKVGVEGDIFVFSV